MSELSGFVYIKSHVILHVQSKAQKGNCACMNNEETCIIHQDRDKFTIATFPANLIALFCHLQTPNCSNVVLEKSKRKNRPSSVVVEVQIRCRVRSSSVTLEL